MIAIRMAAEARVRDTGRKHRSGLARYRLRIGAQ
jgi:hypothetical protein